MIDPTLSSLGMVSAVDPQFDFISGADRESMLLSRELDAVAFDAVDPVSLVVTDAIDYQFGKADLDRRSGDSDEALCAASLTAMAGLPRR